jgi:hypothetical protein
MRIILNVVIHYESPPPGEVTISKSFTVPLLVNLYLLTLLNQPNKYGIVPKIVENEGGGSSSPCGITGVENHKQKEVTTTNASI